MIDPIQFGMVLPCGKKYILRDDGYRVYAREEGTTEGDMDIVVFEYKHSTQPDAYAIVQEILTRAAMVRNNENGNGTPNSVSPDWKSDGTGFRE